MQKHRQHLPSTVSKVQFFGLPLILMTLCQERVCLGPMDSCNTHLSSRTEEHWGRSNPSEYQPGGSVLRLKPSQAGQVTQLKDASGQSFAACCGWAGSSSWATVWDQGTLSGLFECTVKMWHGKRFLPVENCCGVAGTSSHSCHRTQHLLFLCCLFERFCFQPLFLQQLEVCGCVVHINESASVP